MILFGFNTQTYAEFKLVPMDSEFAKDESFPFAMRYYSFMPNPPSENIKAEVPKSAKYGTLNIDKDNSIVFVAFSSDEKKELPDTIIFDQNNDKNLTNDEKFTDVKETEFKTVKLKLASGREFEAKIQLTNWGLQLQPLEWYKGTIELEGKKITAALIDGDGNGFSAATPRDVLLLDLNGNEKFDIDIKTYNITELTLLQDMTLVNGKLYSLKLDESKPDVTLTSYTGDYGKLALEFKFHKELDKFIFTGYLMKDDNRFNIISAFQNDFPIALPAGENNFTMVMFNLTDKSNQRYLVQVSFSKPVIIKKNETTTIPIGDIKPIEVTINQQGNQLKVQKSLVDNSLTDYKMIVSLPEEITSKQFSPTGPAVEIFDEKGNSLTKGEMQYG